MRVGMLGENTRFGCAPNSRCIVRPESLKDVSNGLAAVRHENLLLGFEEALDAIPGIGHDARSGAGSFEDPRRRRVAVSRHAVAVDVESCKPRAEKRIVKIAAHVSGYSHIGWDGLVVPPGASEQKLAVRKQFRRCEEKLL